MAHERPNPPSLKACVDQAVADGLCAMDILAAARAWMVPKNARQEPATADHFLLSREWAAVRMVAIERDGGRCACCGRTSADGVVMNVDHIKPRVRYPELALTPSNLQVLCAQCNEGKGNRYETDWRKQEGGNAEPMAEGSVLHKPTDQCGRARGP